MAESQDPHRLNILEARNRLSQLIRAARSGEEVIIANRGEPVVRLVPLKAERLAAHIPSAVTTRGLGPVNNQRGAALLPKIAPGKARGEKFGYSK